MNIQRIIILILSFTLSQFAMAQSPSCCSASSVTEFAQLGKDLSFVLTHEEPLPYILQNPLGVTTKFSITGEKDGQGYYIKGKKSSTKWIFVIQEWWGLNDYIRNEAEKLHKAFPDAHIFALDMYDGKTATKREEAATLMQTANLKPSIKNKKLINLFYAGQLTVPGPGVPPSIISGNVAAQQVDKYLKTSAHERHI